MLASGLCPAAVATVTCDSDSAGHVTTVTLQRTERCRAKGLWVTAANTVYMCDNSVDSGRGTPPLFTLFFSAFFSVFCQLLPASFFPSFLLSSPEQLYVPYLWALVCSLCVCVCACVCSVCCMSRRQLRVGSTSAADNTTPKHTHTHTHTHTPPDTGKTYQ